MTAERGRPGWKLSLVVPCYNEAPNIRPLHSELTRVIVGLADDYEIIEDLGPLLEGTVGGDNKRATLKGRLLSAASQR